MTAAKRRRRRNLARAVVAWLGVIGLAALVIGTLPAGAAALGSCESSSTDFQSNEEQSELGKFLPASPDPEFRLAFDGSRDRRVVFHTFSSYSGHNQTPRNVAASLEATLASKDGHGLDEESLIVGTTTKPAVGAKPAVVRVCAAMDPATIPNLRPGLYSGTIVLSADNFQDAEIPMTITFRSTRDVGLLLAFGGVVIGLVVKVLSEIGSGQRFGKLGARRAAATYLLQWSFPLTIILGGIAGWLGFMELYGGNPTWGAESADSLKLFGTCFAFQLGGVGGADMAKRLIG